MSQTTRTTKKNVTRRAKPKGSRRQPAAPTDTKGSESLTDAEVIAAIRENHLTANIRDEYIVREYWGEATVDPGGTIFGPGPYVKLPVQRFIERVVIRVYPPARLRKRLQKQWIPKTVRTP